MKETGLHLEDALRDAAAQGKLIITGHDAPDVDSCLSCAMLLTLAQFWTIPARIALPTPPDEAAMRVLPRLGLDPAPWRGDIHEDDFLALVDHHQPLHGGRLAAVIDHHPTDYPPQAPFVLISPSGACAMMLYRLINAAGMPDEGQRFERMAVTALYLDTMALRSAKIPPQEAAWARARALALGMDVTWLTSEGLGLEDMRRPARELARLSLKTYDCGGVRVCSSYVQTDAMTEEKLKEILAEVRAALEESGAARWVFLVQDPVRARTEEIDLTPDGKMERIGYDFLASRGKNIMPRVEREIRQAQKGEGEP